MPLIHSKRPAAFKKNVETEIHHGKEPKQAVVIAYRMAGEHKAHGGEMCAHGGPVHCDMGCYAEGGEVTHHSPAGGSANRAKGANRVRREHGQEGVHKSLSVYEPGTSQSGYNTRGGVNHDYTKGEHEYQLRRLKETGGPTSGRSGFAEGGEVDGMDDDGRISDDDHDELDSVMVDELLEAMEKKDKRGVKDAIEALVLNCLNKKGEY